ncbi:MAG: hypothetical protein H6742_07520 [Alphaproteobacteria bacterium]|nr:hypothetical protein [Alphaproteobacteria bacterium]
MALPLPLLIGLLTACSGASPADAPAPAAPPVEAGATPAPPASAATDAPAAGAPAAPTAPATLPDLSQGLEQGSCGNGPGNEGADSHFLGTFTIDGNQVRGVERWLLSANSKLQASPRWGAGEACEVRWLVVGTTTAPLHCGDCDLGLQLQANVDMTGSTCPEDMVKREKTMTMAYDIRRDADGVAWFYFSSSGKPLGQGYHQGNQLTYVTQHQCKWF